MSTPLTPEQVTQSTRLRAAELDPGVDPARSPLLRSLLGLPLKKLTIWGGLIGLLVLLRDFFPLIFMTFVLSYIANTVVTKIEPRFSARWIPITIFFTLVVAAVVGFVLLMVPNVQREVKLIRDEVTQHHKDDATGQHHGNWNKYLDEKLKGALGKDNYDSLDDVFGVSLQLPESVDSLSVGKAEVALISSQKSLSAGLIVHISPEQKADALTRIATFGGAIWKGIVYVFLTIVFSLMLVFGLPRFRAGLVRLQTSRLADAYNEVAPSLAQFGRLLGRAFEAQTIIAACNTTVTFIGMSIIGIPGSFLLSIVVFICSFIPVAGVFISTTPIAVVALLMQKGGLPQFLGVILMVTIAHILEAYVLNPRIYGHHMKMNPLAVLVILVIAEHSVGVWGLVVAIPLSTYIWKNVILGEVDDDLAAKPLSSSAVISVARPPGEPSPEAPVAARR